MKLWFDILLNVFTTDTSTLNKIKQFYPRQLIKSIKLWLSSRDLKNLNTDKQNFEKSPMHTLNFYILISRKLLCVQTANRKEWGMVQLCITGHCGEDTWNINYNAAIL